MKKYKLPLTLILISLLFYSCFQNTRNSNNTNDLTIEFFSGGGRSSAYENIYISKDSAYREIGNHIEKEIVRWKPSILELENLVELLEDNQYKSITSKENKEEVFDRGGVTIKISYSGNTVELKNSDVHFIKENWSEEFNQIKNGIIVYAGSKQG